MVDICTHGNRPAECADCRERTSWTARELMAATFPAARFAVPDLIPDGLTFFAGAPKLGKSWMALGLGIAIASGGRALGTIDVEGAAVLYLALEDSPRRLQERLALVLADEEPPGGLTFETAWPRMGNGGSETIEAWIGEHPDARLVVVDVLTRIRAPEVRRQTCTGPTSTPRPSFRRSPPAAASQSSRSITPARPKIRTSSR
jgi:hypothetical protein